jgi:hypothetical protein
VQVLLGFEFQIFFRTVLRIFRLHPSIFWSSHCSL